MGKRTVVRSAVAFIVVLAAADLGTNRHALGQAGSCAASIEMFGGCDAVTFGQCICCQADDGQQNEILEDYWMCDPADIQQPGHICEVRHNAWCREVSDCFPGANPCPDGSFYCDVMNTQASQPFDDYTDTGGDCMGG